MDGGIVSIRFGRVNDTKILDGYRRARDMITAWIDRTFGLGILE
jgi:hypothetical protein